VTPVRLAPPNAADRPDFCPSSVAYNQPQEIVNYFLGGPIGSPPVRVSLIGGMIAADFFFATRRVPDWTCPPKRTVRVAD
jgi:hypothetical protein